MVDSTPLNAESRLTTGIRIISADERLREPAGIKGQIWGRYGVGKLDFAESKYVANTRVFHPNNIRK